TRRRAMVARDRAGAALGLRLGVPVRAAGAVRLDRGGERARRRRASGLSLQRLLEDLDGYAEPIPILGREFPEQLQDRPDPAPPRLVQDRARTCRRANHHRTSVLRVRLPDDVALALEPRDQP